MTENDEFLRLELRHALDSREPDRTAMLNRIASNRAAGVRPRNQVVRLAGSALAVATVLGLGGMAKWALADDERGATPPVAAASAPAVSGSAAGPATGSKTPPSTAPSSRPRTSAPPATSASAPPSSAPTPAASLVRGHPGDTKVDKGSLKSTSVAATGQNSVTLIPGAALTSLTIDIRVTLTPGVTAGAATTDCPAGRITATVTKTADALIYHFVLNEGEALQGGKYTFSAAYGGGERDIADDTYEAYAYSVERKDIHVYGNFLPS